MTDAGMDSVSWMRVILACVAVGGLIALMGFVLKYVQMRGFTLPNAARQGRRLQMVESLPLDPRRRLVIVRCDQTEHVLLLGANEDIVIGANLEQHAGGMRTKSEA